MEKLLLELFRTIKLKIIIYIERERDRKDCQGTKNLLFLIQTSF